MDDDNTRKANLASNPFTALFSSVEEADYFRKVTNPQKPDFSTSHESPSLNISAKGDGVERENDEMARLVDDFLQRVFLITVRSGQYCSLAILNSVNLKSLLFLSQAHSPSLDRHLVPTQF